MDIVPRILGLRQRLDQEDKLGALVTAFMLTHRPPLQHAGRLLLLVVTGFGVATILFGISRSFPLSLPTDCPRGNLWQPATKLEKAR